MCRCRRFFENQKVDEIGIYSVKLQKILITLIVLNLLGLFAGAFSNWLNIIVELVLLWVCFYGAYKRKHRALRAYVCINITFMILAIVFLLVAVVFFSTQPVPQESSPMEVEPAKNNDMMDVKPVSKNADGMMDISNSNNNITDLVPPTKPSHNSGPIFVFWILVVFISALVFVLKLVSIIMSVRLARMICQFNYIHLSHPVCNNNIQEAPRETPPPAYTPMQQHPMQQHPMQQHPMYQPMYVPVVVNGQPNGQPQQFVYPNPYFVPQAMYTPMAPPQNNDKN